MKKLLLLAIGLLSALFIIGCSVGVLKGTITESEGNQVQDAEVSIIYDGTVVDTTSTNANGKYIFSKVPLNEDFDIVVKHSEYKEYKETLNLEEKQQKKYTHDMILQKELNTTLVQIQGKVYDKSGELLSNVQLSCQGVQTNTNEEGLYSFEVPVATDYIVVAKKDGYIENTRVIIAAEELGLEQDIYLSKPDITTTILSSEENELFIKGAKVVLPANAYVDSDGLAYEGNIVVQASYNRVTTSYGALLFPGGDYIGEDMNGDEVLLRSYGFIDVVLQDANGNDLDLAEGSKATLIYPMDDNIDEIPSSIPLWYYDIQKGVWVEDSVALYDNETNTYIGDVSHFTSWNLDVKMNGGGRFSGCIVDSNNVPVAANIRLKYSGYVREFRSNHGDFEFYNAPINQELELFAYLGDASSEVYTFTLAEDENKTIEPCIQLDVDAVEEYATIKGKLLQTDGTTSYARIEAYDTNGSFLGNSIRTGYETDTVVGASQSGDFEISYIQRPANGKVILKIFNCEGGEWINDGEYVETKELDYEQQYMLEASLETDVGTIVSDAEACYNRPQ